MECYRITSRAIMNPNSLILDSHPFLAIPPLGFSFFFVSTLSSIAGYQQKSGTYRAQVQLRKFPKPWKHELDFSFPIHMWIFFLAHHRWWHFAVAMQKGIQSFKNGGFKPQQLSNEKRAPGCLGYIGDYTSQLYAVGIMIIQSHYSKKSPTGPTEQTLAYIYMFSYI